MVSSAMYLVRWTARIRKGFVARSARSTPSGALESRKKWRVWLPGSPHPRHLL
jgi:hypothetical protein